jgi:hypothetical protein
MVRSAIIERNKIIAKKRVRSEAAHGILNGLISGFDHTLTARHPSNTGYGGQPLWGYPLWPATLAPRLGSASRRNLLAITGLFKSVT